MLSYYRGPSCGASCVQLRWGFGLKGQVDELIEACAIQLSDLAPEPSFRHHWVAWQERGVNWVNHARPKACMSCVNKDFLVFKLGCSECRNFVWATRSGPAALCLPKSGRSMLHKLLFTVQAAVL